MTCAPPRPPKGATRSPRPTVPRTRIPVTRDLLEDALAMNPTQPVATAAEPAVDDAQPTIGEWGALDEPATASSSPRRSPCPRHPSLPSGRSA